MKITGGALKGRSVPGRVAPGVRPTSSRVREALFSMLGQDLSGLRVLDAYAGSGLLSVEALSRGAERALLIEQRKGTARGLKAALASLGLADRAEVRVGSSPGAWPAEQRFDLIFLDPPYALDPAPVLEACVAACSGRVVLECASSRAVATPEGLELERERRYGDTTLRVYAGLGR
ncbi:MAG: 16S rRNA (guanine(966)-N(2))-methyltransferase RsmD [Alphaproteobacteria bacterium]|nr:16S rRNA (guanine(966)-N(2))-methyltransferase RsmD [Alphaproteobacteria bacterium]MCB9791595.1 16S rRNA (guanine(966)-N(2))-methyltransferase RsmD [Alphaproteobacteria bacterium]